MANKANDALTAVEDKKTETAGTLAETTADLAAAQDADDKIEDMLVPDVPDTDEPVNPGTDKPEDPDEEGPVEDAPFTDVAEDMWYAGPIQKAHDLGIMNGYEGTTLYRLEDTLTREQAAALLYNYLVNGDTASSDAPQDDMVQGEWYSEAVDWAVANGIVNGYAGTDEFGVGNPLTSEQFAAIIANACKADTEDIGADTLVSYPDAGSVIDWAEGVMTWAVENGVVNGFEMPDGTRELHPTAIITRGEMAAMMVNAIEAGVLKADLQEH